MTPPKIGIIISSVRSNRFADHPAKWIYKMMQRRDDVDVELLDLRDYPMPFFDEIAPPAYAPVNDAAAQGWQKKIAEFDGYVVIAAEYNHGMTGAIKNALDYAYKEWRRKPVGFVGYGGVGGARAVEMLRLVCIELEMAPIRTGVHIMEQHYMAALKEGESLDAFEPLVKRATDMLDQLMWWAKALKAAREAG